MVYFVDVRRWRKRRRKTRKRRGKNARGETPRKKGGGEEVSLSRRIRARINIGQRGEVFVGAERNPLLPTLSRHHHHHHYLLSQSCERKRGREGGRERERERESTAGIESSSRRMKRWRGSVAKCGGRTEGCAATQRDTKTKTEVRAAKEGSKAVVSKREGGEKRMRIRATYRTCTFSLSLSLSLSLHARGFTDYAPVDRTRSSARLRAAETRAKATPEHYERVVRERRRRTDGSSPRGLEWDRQPPPPIGRRCWRA